MRWLNKYWLAERIYYKFGDSLFWQEVIALLLRSVLKEEIHHVNDRKLFRCDCGDLYWEDSEENIQKKHTGHLCRLAQKGTPFEYIAIKMGWIK